MQVTSAYQQPDADVGSTLLEAVGFVTATLATYFVGRDAESDEAEVAGAKAISELKTEIAALRADIDEFLRLERRYPGDRP